MSREKETKKIEELEVETNRELLNLQLQIEKLKTDVEFLTYNVGKIKEEILEDEDEDGCEGCEGCNGNEDTNEVRVTSLDDKLNTVFYVLVVVLLAATFIGFIWFLILVLTGNFR